jgi:hypothetical protein
MTESKGHICFASYHDTPDTVRWVEFFRRNCQVYIAPMLNAIMPDGYRSGRWECDEASWVAFANVILDRYETVVPLEART